MQNQIFESNRLIIIESLTDNEDKTGKQLENKLKSNFENTIPIEYFGVSSKNQFYNLFEDIIEKADRNNKPILHLEIHGHESNMGLILNSGELIQWQYIYTYCKELNIKINNNLFLTLAICRGAHLMRTIKPFDRCPWAFILGSFKDLWTDYILDDFVAFYGTLINEKNINVAYEKLKQTNPNAGYEIINSDETFLKSGAYFKKELDIEKNDKIKGRNMLEAIKRTSTFEKAKEKLNIDYNAKIISEDDMINYFSKNYLYATEQMVNDFRRFFYFWINPNSNVTENETNDEINP